MVRQNKAAKELWAQIFRRAKEQPDATMFNPNYQSNETMERQLTDGLREAGWSAEEIKQRINAQRELNLLPNVNSPGVGPGLESILRCLSKRISHELSEAGYTSAKKVELAINPTPGVSAALTNVIMTDEAVLTVSSFFFRWCGLIARAYARTLVNDIPYWTGSAASESDDKLFLLRRPELALYWSRIFLSFAATGTHVLVPYRPSKRHEVILMEQVAWSMEYFSVAHEYGHHVLDHRRIDANPFDLEYEADDLALRVCDKLVMEPFGVHNPYVATGAGASLLLRALDILRSLEQETPVGRGSGTHPTHQDRIERIVNRNVMQPDKHKMNHDFNNTVSRITSAVERFVNQFLGSGGRELLLSPTTTRAGSASNM